MPPSDSSQATPKTKAPWALARLGLAREVMLPAPRWARLLHRLGRWAAAPLAALGLAPLAARLLKEPAGRRLLVPAPPVRTALELYAAAEGALDGDAADRRIVEDLLADWLPGPLFRHLASLPIEEQITTAIDLADEGVLSNADRAAAAAKALQDAADGAAQQEDPFSRASKIEWDILLALYAGAYGGSAWEVYTQTPWTVFLHLVSRIDQVTALRHMLDLDLVLLPHLGEEADAALSKMKERGGEPFGPKPTQSLREQRAAVEELRSLMGR